MCITASIDQPQLVAGCEVCESLAWLFRACFRESSAFMLCVWLLCLVVFWIACCKMITAPSVLC
jgi:hypothetical protein